VDKNQIFALDIGTRKVMGLVMQAQPDGYQVVDVEMMEHSTRAMLDGQIHDVEAVAATISAIKSILESRMQLKLEKASVAAAGRALKTARARVKKRRTVLTPMSREEVRALDIEAVQQAQYQLSQAESDNRSKGAYFCVGYSVVRYTIEEQEIGSLVGQVGAEVGVEVIATFLPRVVVDSLFSALKMSGLEIESLTLEPIAALSVAIPPNMRLLNLALVDIGAGTSDIAVVRGGNIIAYAMVPVPVGGDELTEIIAAEYLLDFDTAEQAKRLLSTGQELELVDILGNKSRVPAADVLGTMKPVVEELTRQVAANILELNQKPPDAVICVGGGSMTPNLTGTLAEHLELYHNRVGIRTPENFDKIKFNAESLQGPQGVTPLGIAYNYFTVPPVPFIKVEVNGRDTVLWNMGELNIASALLCSGAALNNIYGKPGLGKTIEVNGYVKVIKGQMGTPPVIKQNGENCSLEDPVHEGDHIEFTAGSDGQDAVVKVSDLMNATSGFVMVNGDRVDLYPLVSVNGERCGMNDEIPDRARVEFRSVNSLENILIQAGLGEHWLGDKEYRYLVDDKEMFIRWPALEVYVNGVKAGLDQTVEFGSELTYSTCQPRPTIGDLLGDNEIMDLPVKVNGEPVVLKGKGAVVRMNGEEVGLNHEIEDGARISLDHSQSYAIMSDIFQVIDFKPSLHGRLSIKVDGETAGFTTPLKRNCEIELLWEK